MACKVRFDLPLGARRRRVYTHESGEFPETTMSFISMACNHCDNPACAAACPKGAFTRDEARGVVKHDKTKCVGCRRCEWACPYGAVTFNSATGLVSKCDACWDQDGGPACVANCTGAALTWGDITPNAELDGIDMPDPNATNPNVEFVE
jgi:anaerobic dimethyl sulfoxide reductase subunit B (iron-sulfur subunit)